MDLTFRYTPEFTRKSPCKPDGYIQLKGCPQIACQGLTVVELTNNLKSIFVVCMIPSSTSSEDFDKPYFIAGGFVESQANTTFADDDRKSAIAIAGGFADVAKTRSGASSAIFREWMETKVLDLKTVLKGKNLNEDTVLFSLGYALVCTLSA